MTLPAGLEYLDGDTGAWYAVPSWAGFHELVGRLAARGVMGRSRLVIALAVPNRYMAAPMLGLGAILAVSERELSGVTATQRFSELKALPNTAVLRFISPGGDSPRLGTFGGTQVIGGVEYVKIHSRDKGKPCAFYEPLHYATNIQRTTLTPDEIPSNGRGRKARAASHQFWLSFLPHSDLEAFNRDARVECVLFGNGPQLRNELSEVRFRVPLDAGKSAEGTFNDLLRVRKYSNSTGPSWSDVHSTSGAKSLPERMKLAPRVVVFDGPTGFLRWRKYYPDSAWIVVLDKNDPQYDEGVDELNAEIAMNSSDDNVLCVGDDLPPGVTIPPGVEVTAFFLAQAG